MAFIDNLSVSNNYNFSAVKNVTLPYTADKNCFMRVMVSTPNNTNGYHYLKSKKFNDAYYWAFAGNTQGCSSAGWIPVLKGDTISVANTSNINGTNYKVYY